MSAELARRRGESGPLVSAEVKFRGKMKREGMHGKLHRVPNQTDGK
jgi:hypothetical protein